MRRPKGIKTRKSVAKRFKVSATGKISRSRAGRRHLLANKAPGRRRKMGKSKLVDPSDTHKIIAGLPFSH